MRLKKLDRVENGAKNVAITCYKCGTLAQWNYAAANNWAADLDGEPFKAYYCQACTKANERSTNAHN